MVSRFSTYQKINGVTPNENLFYTGQQTLESLIVAQNIVKDPRFLMDNGYQLPIAAPVRRYATSPVIRPSYYHRARTCHEIPGSVCHARCPLAIITVQAAQKFRFSAANQPGTNELARIRWDERRPPALPYCSSTYSRCSTVHVDHATNTRKMIPSPARLPRSDGLSLKMPWTMLITLSLGIAWGTRPCR